MSFAFRPLPPIGDALFRLNEDGAFFFAPLSLAEDVPLPAPDAPIPVAALPAPAATTPEAPLAEPAPAAPVAEAPPIAPAAEPEVPPEPAAVIVEQVAPPEPPPAVPEMADLYAQYASLYADFDGQAALADLLQSAWAQANQWGDAGVAPLG